MHKLTTPGGLAIIGFSMKLTRETVKAYVELSKPRIVTLIVITAAIGYFLGRQGIDDWIHFALAMFGTGLSCAGAAALNNYLERDADLLMKRTRRRPIPSGLISPNAALYFGIALVVISTVQLAVTVNLLTAFIALMTAFLYVLVYTPLKKITWLNTFVGAIPGALPPLGGWAAATDEVSYGAWVLFLILFLWQHPHFYAIAWMYREDYERGGFKMLPVVEPDGLSTFRQIIVYSALLIPISLLPTVIGMSGPIYFWGALFSGLAMLLVGAYLGITRSVTDARRLLRTSVIYLPILLVLIVTDKGF
ncbi:MAG: Protoheme farnesyltransferase [Pseudomonadota bacterium]|jgi:protoheme IX farnesyltransferase